MHLTPFYLPKTFLSLFLLLSSIQSTTRASASAPTLTTRVAKTGNSAVEIFSSNSSSSYQNTISSGGNDDSARTQYFRHPWPDRNYKMWNAAYLVQKFSNDFLGLPLNRTDYSYDSKVRGDETRDRDGDGRAKFEKVVMWSETNLLRMEEVPMLCRFRSDDEEVEEEEDGGKESKAVMVVEIVGEFRIEFWTCRARRDYFEMKDRWSTNWLAAEKNRKKKQE